MTQHPMTSAAQRHRRRDQTLALFESLFARVVPEVADGSVGLVAAARYPGRYARVAVRSRVPALNAASACIGRKGVRVHEVERMLRGEQVSVVNFDDDPCRFVQNALVVNVDAVEIVDAASRDIRVIVSCAQFAAAIGPKARNVRLATVLTGWRIEVCTDKCRGPQHVHPRFDAHTGASTLAPAPARHNRSSSRKAAL